MKKRMTAFLLALYMVLTVLPGAALAAEPGGESADRDGMETAEGDAGVEAPDGSGLVDFPVPGGTISFNPSAGMIVGYTGYPTSAEIPSSINGIPVTGIGSNAFSNSSSLIKVTIPSSVTTIQDFAFRGNSALKSVTIPSSVTNVGVRIFLSCPQLKTAGPIGSGCSIEFGWSSEIPSGVFDSCNELESVILPDTITKIGTSAFRDCKNLKKVKLPSGLTRVEENLFSGCSSLTEVIISGKVSSIGRWAFSNCTNLNHVTIPGSVTDINLSAFEKCTSTSLTSAGPIGSGCSIEFGWTEELPNNAFNQLASLTRVKLPSGITRIGDYAFRQCSGLKSIEIPDSVTWIGCAAFKECTSLESIKIPASVQAMDHSVFDSCSNLRYVVILNSEMEMYGTDFKNCENLTDVYYNGGEEEWEKWNGYKNLLPKSVTIHFNSTGPVIPPLSSIISLITKSAYTLHIVDPDGNDLPLATVSIDGGKEVSTDWYGRAQFIYTGEMLPKITVSLDGYSPWVRPESKRPYAGKYETVVLQPLSTEAPGTLDACRFSRNRDMTDAVDLLTRVQTVVLGEENKSAFYIKCAASVKEGEDKTVSRYQLWQNKRKIQEDEDGFFVLYPGLFEPNENCFIRVYAGLASWDTEINLKFMKVKLEDFPQAVDLGASIPSVEMPESVPLLGGSTLELKFDRFFPVTVTVSDEEIRMAVNLKAAANKEEREELMEEAEKLIRRTRLSGSLMRGGLSARDRLIYNSLIREEEGGKKEESWEFNILGYLEGNLSSSTLTGSLVLQVKSPDVKYKYNTVVVVLPVTVHVTVNAEGTLIGGVSYDWAQNQLSGSLDLDVSGSIHVFGGPGVDDAVAVGAYGEPKLELSLHILETPMRLTYLRLTGAAGLEAYCAGRKYTMAFWDAKEGWQIWPPRESTAGLYADDGDWYAPENWELQDLSYLEEEPVWLGDGVSLYAAGASTTLTPLLQNTYRDARPVLAAGEDGLYAAFLQADAGSIYTAVTKYDGTRWLNPVRVDADAVLDGAPVLLSDGGNIGNVE